jgi:hypothetical protein
LLISGFINVYFDLETWREVADRAAAATDDIPKVTTKHPIVLVANELPESNADPSK